MEMRIDTAINNLSMYDIDECGNAELHTWYNGIGKDMEESFMLAIEIMQNYQKIKEIVEHWSCCGNPVDSMIAICEVLEDGNDD